jgi:TolB-like protein/Flp pilus assembly protein TadD
VVRTAPAAEPASATPEPAIRADEGVSPASDDTSIAVLPFVDMSPDGDQEYFGDGIAEELINGLVRLRGLRVAARTSTFALKGQGYDVREIGQRLGVTSVLEGSIRKSGNRLRITAQLIEIEHGYHLWSETYDRDLEDVFKIQDDITKSVVAELASELLGSPEKPLTRAPTDSAEAFELYMKGRYLWYRRYLAPLQTAIEHFERAIDLDPGFALAYTGIADAYSILGFYHFMSADEAATRARSAAKKALDLDPGLAQAHASLAFVHLTVGWGDGDFSDAVLVPMRRAIELNPTYGEARVWLGLALATLGRLEEGARATAAAVKWDPHSAYTLAIHAATLYVGRRYEEAKDAVDRALEIEPDNVVASYTLAWILGATGDGEGAVATGTRLLEITGAPPAFRALHGRVLGYVGRHAEAQQILSDLEALPPEDPTGDVWRCFAAIGAGRLDEGRDYFLEAMRRKEPWMFMTPALPAVDPIRADPRVREAIDACGIDARAFERAASGALSA